MEEDMLIESFDPHTPSIRDFLDHTTNVAKVSMIWLLPIGGYFRRKLIGDGPYHANGK